MNIELSNSNSYFNYCQRVGNLKQGGEPPCEELLRKLKRELNRSPVKVNIVAQRRINAYQHTLYGGTGKEDHSWQPGDFVCHTPGIDQKRRIEFFKSIL